MAKGIRELRRRIRGVKNIAQITRAMEMVASTKLKRLQERAEGSKPYAQSLKAVVAGLADTLSPEDYPLLAKREQGAVGLLIVSADKGLCGAYNSNLFRAAAGFAKAHTGRPVKAYVLGARGRGFFARNEPRMTEGYEDGLEKIPFTRVRDIVKSVVKRFLAGELAELHIVSTRFQTQAIQRPEIMQLLPIDPAQLREGGAAAKSGHEPLFEPSAGEILSRLLPKYLEVQVYGAVLEALASEFAMRRMAMKAATDAAKDMIGSLTRQYNRARQETITKELLEIVGGAEALKG
jgi:F-type H+-transporting ATPase subunit gamma